MKIHLQEVTYIGHLLTKDGVRPHPRKVEDIHSLKTPIDVKSLKRLVKFFETSTDNLSQLL